jgi:hypothetical protein
VLDHLAEVAPLLGVRGERVDEAHDRRVHVHGHGGAGTAPCDGADDGDIGRHVEPEAAVGLGDGRGQEAVALQLAPAIDRVGARRVVLGGARGDLLARDARRPVDEGLLGRCQWRHGS